MRGVAIAIAFTCCAAPISAQTLHDRFNSGRLSKSKWTTQEILPGQFDFTKPGRCGASAIEVVTRDGDNGVMCEDDCQRAELRTARKTWPSFGEEMWYAFSFRISGDVPSMGSGRAVIGQWKGPGDRSPMVAQRFDNGVFHITVQDNDVRRVVATADGDPDRVVSAQDMLSKINPHDQRAVSAVKSLQALDMMTRMQPGLSRQFFNQKLLALLQHDQQSEETNSLSRAMGVESVLLAHFGSLYFLSEPEKYIGAADIEITTEKDNRLPDPTKGWVDMVYRIKPGRTDNEYGPRTKGEVDVWANGQKIVSVRGNIGRTLRKDRPLDPVGPYFKFGTYRVRLPGTFTFQFDEFSQAPSREGLVSFCPVR